MSMDTIADSPALDPLLNELRGVAFEMGAVFAIRQMIAGIDPKRALQMAAEEAEQRYKCTP